MIKTFIWLYFFIRIFIKSKLKEKTKIKNSQEYIDCYYVLRLLLEYYRFDRKVRFKLLTDSFHSLPNEHINRKSLTLKSFKAFKIMIEKNFPHTTELQKAELFRECFQIGQGEISFDVFFTVLSESNYFVTTLKLKSFLTLPLNVAANLTKCKFVKKLITFISWSLMLYYVYLF